MNTIMLDANVEALINEAVAYLEQVITGPDGDAFLEGLGILAGIAVFMAAFMTVMAVIRLVCRWRIFTKAGEKGWKTLIPVYNTYTEFSFTWSALQGILMLGALLAARIISFVCDPESFVYGLSSILAAYAGVLALIQTHKLSRSFGHKFGFTLGLIFLNPIFMLILAFGKKSQYVGPAVKTK